MHRARNHAPLRPEQLTCRLFNLTPGGHHPLDGEGELIGQAGFRDHLVESSRQRGDALVLHGVRREGDDGNTRERRIGAEDPQGVGAGHQGHSNVHHDEIGRVRTRLIDGLLSVSRDDDAIASKREVLLVQL